MNALKTALTDALVSFKGNGLLVEQRTGRSMFPWKINCCFNRGVGQ